jgi:hypothetical protein
VVESRAHTISSISQGKHFVHHVLIELVRPLLAVPTIAQLPQVVIPASCTGGQRLQRATGSLSSTARGMYSITAKTIIHVLGELVKQDKAVGWWKMVINQHRSSSLTGRWFGLRKHSDEQRATVWLLGRGVEKVQRHSTARPRGRPQTLFGIIFAMAS